MKIAIWIIAVVELIRIIQNTIQLIMVSRNNSNQQMKRATDALIQSFNKVDEDWIKDAVKEWSKRDSD